MSTIQSQGSIQFERSKAAVDLGVRIYKENNPVISQADMTLVSGKKRKLESDEIVGGRYKRSKAQEENRALEPDVPDY